MTGKWDGFWFGWIAIVGLSLFGNFAFALTDGEINAAVAWFVAGCFFIASIDDPPQHTGKG